jgi:hypothetical protein
LRFESRAEVESEGQQTEGTPFPSRRAPNKGRETIAFLLFQSADWRTPECWNHGGTASTGIHDFVYLPRSLTLLNFTPISRLASTNYQTRKTAKVKLRPHAFSIFSLRIPFNVTASAANLEIPSLSFSTAICSSLKSNRKSASSSR